MEQDHQPLTQEMIERIQAAVMAIATSVGWGQVVIIVERGEPKLLLETRSERLKK